MIARATGEVATLDRARATVEAIDAQLITLIAARQAAVQTIGEAKRDARRPVLDPAREAQVLRRVTELARAEGLDEDAVRTVWRTLLAMARKAQVTPSP